MSDNATMFLIVCALILAAAVVVGMGIRAVVEIIRVRADRAGQVGGETPRRVR